MQTEDIRQLAEWLAATDIDFLELRGPDAEVRIHRDGAAPDDTVRAPGPDAGNPANPVTSAAEPVTVLAPSLGVLRDRPPGRAAPLCAAGAAVQAGSLVALLQVGPLLLPVRAPAGGWAGEWRVPPGSTVGYGTPLLDIFVEPSADAT
ncbi:hypothetical protein RD110_09680 [Rhodoferax koreense]|uniref:Lipoyl-binding domain-containing protein n=1 Tax=Rhodoferax koreensis TaxID=1842727 RepID=A0A1P8K3K9_9BURK|nr:hypothetical protein [Rhodoferax koreense]APW40595.1 hypothetical protein RD110_09680 [Rhodoferax koreense]